MVVDRRLVLCGSRGLVHGALLHVPGVSGIVWKARAEDVGGQGIGKATAGCVLSGGTTRSAGGDAKGTTLSSVDEGSGWSGRGIAIRRDPPGNGGYEWLWGWRGRRRTYSQDEKCGEQGGQASTATITREHCGGEGMPPTYVCEV